MYSTMDTYIADFSNHIRKAMEIGQAATINPLTNEVKNIVVAGLGGSGIGGAFVTAMVGAELNVPLIVNSDYNLPAFVDEHTLVIASSYSGNTEETLSMFSQAVEKGSRIICITTNGKLGALVDKHNLDCVKIPAGVPPRGALGLSFVPQLYILEKLGLISNEQINNLAETANFIDNNETEIQADAKEIATKLFGTIPYIYTTVQIEALAIRFRQQINENSKMLASHHVVPEMNHNELVGWRTKLDNLSAVFIHDKDDLFRNTKRMEIVSEVASKYARDIVKITAKGANRCQRLMYLVHLTDWVTFYLAEMNQVDAVEVDVIDYLKGELTKL